MDPTVKQLFAQNIMLAGRVSALEALITRGGFDINPVADPAPDESGGLGGLLGGILGRFGGGFQSGTRWWDIPIHWDPSPEELNKLSRVQIESRLSDIANLRKKLDGAEQMFKEALGRQG